MVGRRLKARAYDSVLETLMEHARNGPLSPIYEADIMFNGERYTLFLQPDRHDKIYALYAIHSVFERDVGAVGHDLITDNVLLSSFMELYIYQVAKAR